MVSQRRLCLLLLATVGVAQDNRGTDPNNHFIYPELPGNQPSEDPTVYASNKNLTYGIAQSQPFQWKTNLTYIALNMVQETPVNPQQRILIGCASATESLLWDGQISPIDPAVEKIAYLAIWECQSDSSGLTAVGTPVFFSHYFNLTAPADGTATSSSVSSMASTASLSTATSPETTSSTASATGPSATPSSGPVTPNSNSGAVGGGVGGALGGLIIILIAAFFFYRYRRKQKQKELLASNQRGHSMSEQHPYQDYRSSQRYEHTQPSELDSSQKSALVPPSTELPLSEHSA